tara:strand:+ start:93 stop:806 length:714 start_codon:yes stop_codon:yes gene_type:complete
MKKRIFILNLILVFTFFQSCEDLQEPSGIETRVFGRMYDNQNQLPLTNHKLRIGEYNLIPGSGSAPNIEFIQYVDSTLTDLDGYYDFTFSTSGQGDRYKLEVDFDFDTYATNDGNFFGLLNQEYHTEIENLEVDTELNYEILFVFPVNIKITLDSDVQFLPIRIQKPYYRATNNLTETGIEITRLFYVDKNSNWEIILRRTKSDGQNQRVIMEMPATNSSDLTEFEISINDNDFEDY